MKKREPSQGQFLGLWRTAMDLGLDREMVEMLVPDFTAQMKERRDKILADHENCLTFELSAIVHQGRPYLEALEEAAPNTPSFHNARKAGDLYPPASDKEEKVDFILRNFPKCGDIWDNALRWAKSKGYKTTNPREGFAVVKQHDLRTLLKRNYLYLVATDECSFGGDRQAVSISVGDSCREASLGGLGCFGDGGDWFLFRK